MDTFGRLPTDVINTIEKMYQLPIIDIEGTHQLGYKLIIKYPYTSHDINFCEQVWVNHPLFHETNNTKITYVQQFIQQLKNNVSCAYYEHVTIIYNEDLMLRTRNHTMILHKNCVVSLIIAMEKYCKMLQEINT